MATPVIKLEPIRMAEIASVGSNQKYVSPSMRKEQPAKVDLGGMNFPSLAAPPQVKKVAPENNMKDKIKENIRIAELEEEQRQKPREEDPYKMTRKELLDDGWTILSLKSAKDIAKNFTISPPFGDLDGGFQ
jgi:hypothetical protein